MMTRIFIFMPLLLVFQASAKQPLFQQKVINYKFGHTSYEITKKKDKLLFRDQLGLRVLESQKCNQHLVSDFWDKLIRKYTNLQLSKSSRKPAAANLAVVSLNGHNKRILPFEAGFKYFLNAPNKFDFVFFQSVRKCKK